MKTNDARRIGRNFAVTLKTLSAAALIGISPAAAHAGPPGYIHAYANGKVDKGATSGVRSVGTWRILANAWDSDVGWDLPPGQNGPYGPVGSSYGPVGALAAGSSLRASSLAELNTFSRWAGLAAPGWDTGNSFAQVKHTATFDPTDAEDAFANSFVIDPASYQVGPTENSTRFFINFNAGTSILAISDPLLPNASASARLSGFMDTTHQRDLTNTDPLGRLFTYSWSTSSDSPSGYQFSFTSNPALGLNDATIMSTFMNAVQFNPLTGYTLATDVAIVSQPIPATPGYVYDLGGETQYNAVGAVPSPAAFSLLCMTGLAVSTRRRRA